MSSGHGEMTTIDEVGSRLRTALRVSALRDLDISCEARNLKRTEHGHFFVDLVSERTVLPAAVWASTSIMPPEEGPALVRLQRVDWVASQGRLRGVLTGWQKLPPALCSPAARRESVRRLLASEGILSRKRSEPPELVSHLCVVTSEGSRAEGDILQGIRERWPGLRTTLVHATVQGERAPGSLRSALRIARAQGADVIICARGGGSERDLDTFNEESVVRAIAEPGPFLICAVGHEGDHLLAEEAADLRAKTPTAAVEKAIPRLREEERSGLMALRAARDDTLERLIESWRQHWHRAEQQLRTERSCVGARAVRRTSGARVLARGASLEALERARRRFWRLGRRLNDIAATSQSRFAATLRVRWLKIQTLLVQMRKANAEERASGRARAFHILGRDLQQVALMRAMRATRGDAARLGCASRLAAAWQMLRHATQKLRGALASRHDAWRCAAREAAAAALAKQATSIASCRETLHRNYPRTPSMQKRGSAWVCDATGMVCAMPQVGNSLLLFMDDAIVDVMVRNVRPRQR